VIIRDGTHRQPAPPGLRDATTKKETRRELLLFEMDAAVAWGGVPSPIAQPLQTMLGV